MMVVSRHIQGNKEQWLWVRHTYKKVCLTEMYSCINIAAAEGSWGGVLQVGMTRGM